ncbi:MAG: DUF2851 family protein [Cytophagaceae bacterium]
MKEDLLQFVWSRQAFSRPAFSHLGEEIIVLNPGTWNTDSGPDFLNARIVIGGIEWVGHVEVHVLSSGWKLHTHDQDQNYNNVILHVVWQNDKPAERYDKTLIPALELKDKIPLSLLDTYEKLNQAAEVPCTMINHKFSLKEIRDVLLEHAEDRLIRKAQDIVKLLNENSGDWEETAYQLLMERAGLKINNYPFKVLAKSLPFKIIKKHSHKPEEVEALLFGQAGFLNKNFTEEYPSLLNEIYSYLKHKYQLSLRLNDNDWKFLRTRPANFPTLRIAELSAFFSKTDNLFSEITRMRSVTDAYDLLSAQLHCYWTNHFRFEEKSENVRRTGMGKTGFENIVINCFAPLIAAFGIVTNEDKYIERARKLMSEARAEDNIITRKFQSLYDKPDSAFVSQGMIQLYNNFCSKKKCLNCKIGQQFLNYHCVSLDN